MNLKMSCPFCSEVHQLLETTKQYTGELTKIEMGCFCENCNNTYAFELVPVVDSHLS